LCHAPDVTLSEEQQIGARLESVAGEPLGIGSPGARLLALRPWLASVAGQEPNAWRSGVVDRVPRARGSPQALGQRCLELRLGRTPWPDGARERAQWA
jgi:hypothetical protein